MSSLDETVLNNVTVIMSSVGRRAQKKACSGISWDFSGNNSF